MLHLKAAKMEAALLGGLIRAIVPKLISLGHERYKLHKTVKSDIEFLVRELRMILGTIEASSEQGDGHGAVSSLWIEDLRELAFGIEDFLDGLTYHAIWKQQPASFRKIVGLPKMLRTQLQFAGERKKLRNKSTEIYEQMKRYKDLAGAGAPQSSAAPMDESPSQVFHPRNILHTDLVGVDGLRAELLEQLAEATGQLKVIAIVGFCGLGKTAVAAQVYNSQTGDGRFEKHAWVCAAGRRPTEVLADVLSELTAHAGCSQGLGTSTKDRQLCEDIRKQLHNKRYLIVIDDIQTQDMWRNIKSAFPDNSAASSRILVTTTILSVANACSSAENYVHKMRRLDKGCSKKLLSSKACPNNEYSCYKHKDSEAILKKCGGQPLALVTIGEFLQTKGWPTGSSCKDICNKLHYHLKIDRTFDEMRRALIRNYTSLPDHALKACLLYFGMFPIDYQIKRKSLFRLWLAEGFVDLHPSNSTPDAATAFDVLKDRNIIERVYVSNNKNVKTTCQTYSMMHEVILHMPISRNFVTLLCDETTKTKFVRRLSLHENAATDENNLDTEAFSLIRSLMVFGKTSEAVISLSGLKELCLSCVKFKTDLLEALTLLSNLEYLKLIADDLEKFTIKEGAFPILIRLCFVLKHPTFPTIEKGSMEQLKTLQLLCKDLHGLCSITLEYLGNLKEVILDDGVHPDTWRQWEEAAKKHTKKPKVFPFKTAESSKREAEAEISEKHTEDMDTSMPVNEGSSCAEQKTHNSCAFQASSGDRSTFNYMGVLEVSPLTKLSDLTTVYSANNSISTDETIAQTHTQIPISEKLGSSDEPKRQHRSADMHNRTFKSTGVSEDSISTELSITGLFSGLRTGHVSRPYSKRKATYQG